MSARNSLNPLQFSMVPDSDSGTHSIDAFHPGYGGGRVPVGTLIWDRQTGKITNISVDKKYQRQGIGTMMYNHAMSSGLSPAPLHSPVQTGPGKNWASKVGGPSL